jgi:hypothetical protein
MVRHLAVAAFAVAALIQHVGVHAQSPQAGAQAEQTTIIGCLRAGANDSEFVLVNDEQVTYQVQTTNELDLASHLNHRIELTGTVEKTDTATIFKASALKMVATSCEP